MSANKRDRLKALIAHPSTDTNERAIAKRILAKMDAKTQAPTRPQGVQFKVVYHKKDTRTPAQKEAELQEVMRTYYKERTAQQAREKAYRTSPNQRGPKKKIENPEHKTERPEPGILDSILIYGIIWLLNVLLLSYFLINNHE